jgi:hypothetical protein
VGRSNPGKGPLVDSDLCILEPVNSMQMMVFKQLKMTGLLCSRYSAGGGVPPAGGPTPPTKKGMIPLDVKKKKHG